MGEESSKTHCICCREEIQKGALKCTKCDTFQDWRRFFSVSNVTLSLIIALIANTTALFTMLKSYSPKSFQVKAHAIAIKPEYLQLAVANTGDTIAIVRGGALKVKRNGKVEQLLELRLQSADGKLLDPSIEPNKSKVIELLPFHQGTQADLEGRRASDSLCMYAVELDYIGFEEDAKKFDFETECLGRAQ